MKYCYVPGCPSNLSKENIAFFNIPDRPKGGVTRLRQKRRLEWAKAIGVTNLGPMAISNISVCGRHFVSGRPAHEYRINNVDWTPSLNLPRIPLKQENSVQNIIRNLPEVTVPFDIPDYVIVDESHFNEQQIEKDLIRKYITSPVCDENGYLIDDHDYLGLPFPPLKTENETDSIRMTEDHTYSLRIRPACTYFDSRNFCNICARNCFNLFSFNNHMVLHTLQNHVTCKICSLTFLTTTCLNSHIAVHTNLCEVCGNEVPVVQLKSHQLINRKQIHDRTDVGGYVVPQKQKIYFCILCMKKMLTRKEYIQHVCK